MRRRSTARFFVVTVVSVLLASATAGAAGDRIGVATFDGPSGASVRKKAMAALRSHGYEVVSASDVEAALSSSGGSLDTEDGRTAVAKEASLAAIVTGAVSGKHAKIVVYDGSGGAVLGSATFTGGTSSRLAKEVGATFWRKLGRDVARGQVPAGSKAASRRSAEDDGASPEAARTEAATTKKRHKLKMEEEPSEETAATPAPPSGLPWLEVEVGLGGENRSLAYNQNIQINSSAPTIRLLPYTLGAGPIAIANVVMYPLDPLVGGALGDLGAEVAIQQGFAIASSQSSMVSFANVVHDYAGGLRYRFPFGTGNDFYVSATAGEDAFTFQGANRNAFYVPDTVYRYARPGLGLHLSLTDTLSLALSGGYRFVFNGAGDLLSDPATGIFPHLTVAGADAQIVGGLRLSPLFELRAGLEWRRYWYDMHSQVGDPAIAGGMVDQSFAFSVRIAMLFGGASAPAAGAGAAPPSTKKPGRTGDAEGTAPSGEVGSDAKSGGDGD